MKYPCHKLPKEQWCDYNRKIGKVSLGGFMGHTCIKQNPKEQNFPKESRNEITGKEIAKSIKLVKEKIEIRLLQKHRGSYISNHETYGIIAEEFDELLKALRANDNQEFYAELIDIAVGAILGMASMYANKKTQVRGGGEKRTC